MSSLRRALVGLALLWSCAGGPEAQAAPVVYRFDGTLDAPFFDTAAVIGTFVYDAVTVQVPTAFFSSPTYPGPPGRTNFEGEGALPYIFSSTNPTGEYLETYWNIDVVALQTLVLVFQIDPVSRAILGFTVGPIMDATTIGGPDRQTVLYCEASNCTRDTFFFVAGTVAPVSAPGSLALFALALPGLIGLRRRAG